jgi:hypothetical protein
MAELDRVMARALVEAGYMPLGRYIELFGKELQHEHDHVDSPATAPDTDDMAPLPVKVPH